MKVEKWITSEELKNCIRAKEKDVKVFESATFHELFVQWLQCP